MEVSVNDPSAANHEFMVIAPVGTGVDIASAVDAPCVYPATALPPDTIRDTGWVSAGSNGKATFHLVRCRLGVGERARANSWITIYYRPQGASANKSVNTTFVKRAPHHNDNIVYYRLCGNPPSLPLDVDYPASISLGAAAWNTGSQIGVSFRKLTNETCSSPDDDPHSSNANKMIVSVAHWTPGSANGCSKLAYGCVKPSVILGQEEHYGGQTLYYRHPLIGTDIWVDKTHKVRSGRYYLPAVISHEFGHTAGLGHSPRDADLMYHLAEGFDDPNGPLRPQQNDRDAMRALYPAQSHRH